VKVFAINGSPRPDNNTGRALGVMRAELEKNGIETEVFSLGRENIHGCTGCRGCFSAADNFCVITGDSLNSAAEKARAADGLVFAVPTYYAGIAGTMKCFLDRLFYSSSRFFRGKAGASLTVARRAGGVDTIHQLNNYMNLAEMVIAPSHYWASVFGMSPGEIEKDGEGIQTIRRNAGALAWLLKIIDAAKETHPFPAIEERVRTNFIR
jgi:multimeric flavodoxin WrbA